MICASLCHMTAEVSTVLLKVLNTNNSLVPRPSHHPVFDRLQFTKTNREGLVHFILCDINVYLGR